MYKLIKHAVTVNSTTNINLQKPGTQLYVLIWNVYHNCIYISFQQMYFCNLQLINLMH